MSHMCVVDADMWMLICVSIIDVRLREERKNERYYSSDENKK